MGTDGLVVTGAALRCYTFTELRPLGMPGFYDRGFESNIHLE